MTSDEAVSHTSLFHIFVDSGLDRTDIREDCALFFYMAQPVHKVQCGDDRDTEKN